MSDTIVMKQCTGPCGRLLAATSENFDKERNGLFGLRARCKQCRREADSVKKEKKRLLTPDAAESAESSSTAPVQRKSDAAESAEAEKLAVPNSADPVRRKFDAAESAELGRRKLDDSSSAAEAEKSAEPGRQNQVDAAESAESLSITELARQAGVTPDVVRGLIHRRTLRAFRVPGKYRRDVGEWRIGKEDADAYITAITAPTQESETSHESDGEEQLADAPTLRGTPDHCGSCGSAMGNILGDVDDTTHQRYGYLCARCHRFVQLARGDTTRIRNVLKYLEQTRPHHVQ